jgi:EpsI family protein
LSPTRRHALLLALGMGAAAALAAALKPERRTDAAGLRVDLDRLIPDQFGTWQTDRVAAAFVRASDRKGSRVRLYDQVLERTFIDGQGRRVMLSIAYGAAQSSDLQLHRPEVCYRAGGFDIRDQRATTLVLDGRTTPVTQLQAQMPGRPEPITYWMVIGGRVASDAARPLRDRLLALTRPPLADSLLVRVSSIDTDTERAYRLHSAFADELVRAIAPQDRAKVIGLPPQG